MVTKVKFKNIIILSVFSVFFVSSLVMFFIFVQFYNDSIEKSMFAENRFSAKVAEDFLAKERESVANDSRRIAGNKVLFVALRNNFYLLINKYTADKDPIKKLPLNVLNYKKIVNDIEIETFGYHGDSIKRYFEVYDSQFNLVGYTGKKNHEDASKKEYYRILYQNYTAASNIGLDVCDIEEGSVVIKGIYLISFYDERYGFSVVKEYIDSAFLDRIKKLTNRDIILVKDNKIVNSTLYIDNEIVTGTELGELDYGKSKAISIKGRNLNFDFIPIVDYNKNPIAYIGVGFDLNLISDIYKKSVIKFWQYLLGFTIVLLVSLVLLLNRLFKPFNSLSSAITEIADGNYKDSIDTDSIPELEPFIKSIDNLSKKVKLRERALKDLNYDLEQKVEERTAELNQKNLELEQNIRRLKETQLHLILSEKMASIGKLAAGIAHEINSPLSAVFTTSQLMKHDLDVIPDLDHRESFSEYIDIIEEGARKSRNIISRLFKTAPDSETYLEVINLSNTLSAIVRDYINSGNTTVKFIEDIDYDIFINANLSDIKKAVTAIIQNAKDAIDSSGHMGEITISCKKLSSYVQIDIKDNGVGIDNEYLSKVFDPFYTTKDVGKGVGLGMTEVYEIIKRHGGSINLESEKGSWTIVTIRIDNK